MMAKKEWKKPELIILMRGRSEQVVLLACKSGNRGGGSTGWDSTYHNCATTVDDICEGCAQPLAS